MSNKRFFWLKLKKDFFKRHDIKIIESMPNGKDYILFYLKLVAESIDHVGHLRFNETIPYNADMLSTITDTNVDIVKSACDIFIKLNLMEKLDDGTLFLTESAKMIGSESSSTERVRKYRENKPKALQCNTDVTNCNDYIELELDKELDKDKKKESKRTVFKQPSKSEIVEYITDKQLSLDVDTFLDHYESNGWKIGKNKMKDWKATVRNWARNTKSFKEQKKPRSKMRASMDEFLAEEGVT